MIELILLLVLVGAVLYVVQTQTWIDPAIKMLIRVIVVVVVLLWIVRLFGLDIPLPRLRG